jgi:hypothetical protein
MGIRLPDDPDAIGLRMRDVALSKGRLVARGVGVPFAEPKEGGSAGTVYRVSTLRGSIVEKSRCARVGEFI